ncbi:hypothetical protein [Paracoccus zhejiangensis]|uniref:Uncharacterized protein n=1 Tax=Paracoccus zhejiangensis TaxID=1077935 RepID=A0A2H5F352_9RHOB|nr:hypothetical protein [Paracoccus zhejiangensis]AUH65981.1 hypothetical protein CX676_18970 [Paracoccus zhejiangensis]
MRLTIPAATTAIAAKWAENLPMTHAPRSPALHHFETAQVLRMAERLDVADYDALLTVSVSDPAAYWQVAQDWLGI